MNEIINSLFLNRLKRWSDFLPGDLPSGAYKDGLKKRIIEELNDDEAALMAQIRNEATLAQVMAHHLVFGSEEARKYIAALTEQIGKEAEEQSGQRAREHDLNWLVGEIRKIPGVL